MGIEMDASVLQLEALGFIDRYEHKDGEWMALTDKGKQRAFEILGRHSPDERLLLALLGGDFAKHVPSKMEDECDE